METLGGPAGGSWKDWILDELNLQVVEDWPENEKRQARELLTKWEHLFAPHMYDDVKAHFQEMLYISTIWESYSPWASAVVLV